MLFSMKVADIFKPLGEIPQTEDLMSFEIHSTKFSGEPIGHALRHLLNETSKWRRGTQRVPFAPALALVPIAPTLVLLILLLLLVMLMFLSLSARGTPPGPGQGRFSSPC